ncbi:conserved Plasmodium protein, unknown function [Plasmodium knowlesi strain H]|uniref:Uncharacterized protein n=3 Tax=Plasmodium knowlesi TaxID=5850 RepID=A0A5K1U6B0_PLAKH|nr:conserved Plasmodium protein, unknown function [Plasmodium knowlesi strain H]OTN68729.1 Uncharacterized protein PKNOH_S01010500 [Plasmodium knowlesi]CAA9986106.1 conserved Plasmodium protein, unknown function [Plasmodium knowlesi strain H]SBO25266.1 conserved Plasmodium protein, unknown function [Plasmodium knowlesi strain H]SBO27602.1 conserved Plasmodium protein, unknown function [Plasmodium knowlesi strain H]VVS75580.1 conserved Plasmodium protein, unknown function [Plasmodium knowlesi s|eukprot:XP_002257517.1 hypothetical protein, conserved in Plasmodium species [Plasmodium knowlesi strain H]
MNEKEQKRYAKIIESIKYTQNENILLENLNAICQNEGKRQDNQVVIQLIDIFLEENNYSYNENFLFNYNLLKRSKELHLTAGRKNKSEFSKQYKICVKHKNVEKVNEEDSYYFALRKKNLCTFSREFLNAKKVILQFICNSVLKGCVHINYLVDKIYVDFQIKSSKNGITPQSGNYCKHLICNDDLVNILIETIFTLFVRGLHEEHGDPHDMEEEKKKRKKNFLLNQSDIQKSYLMHSKEQNVKDEMHDMDNDNTNLVNILKKLINIDKSFVKNVFYIFLKNVEKLSFKNVHRNEAELCACVVNIFKEIISYCDEFEIGTVYHILLNNEVVRRNRILHRYIVALCILNLRNVYNAYNLELCMGIVCGELRLEGEDEEETESEEKDCEETDGEEEDDAVPNDETFSSELPDKAQMNTHELAGNAAEERVKHLVLFLLIFAFKIYDISYLNGCVQEPLQRFLRLLRRNMHSLKDKFYHVLKTIIFFLILVFHNLNIDKNETVMYILECLDILLEAYYPNGVFLRGSDGPANIPGEGATKVVSNEEAHVKCEEYNSVNYADNGDQFCCETEGITEPKRCEREAYSNMNEVEGSVLGDNSSIRSKWNPQQMNLFEFNISPLLLCLTIPIHLEYNLNQKNEENSNGVNRRILDKSRRLKSKWVTFFKNYNNCFGGYLRRRDMGMARYLDYGIHEGNPSTQFYRTKCSGGNHLSIMENIMEEVNYLTSESNNLTKEDILEILCVNNILFYLHEIFVYIDLIYLMRFFQMCENDQHKFRCINVVLKNRELLVLFKMNTKFCINTFENLKNENISKVNFVYINLLILSLFECNLFYVFKFMSYYCLINSFHLLWFIPSLLFVYKMSFSSCEVQGGSFKMVGPSPSGESSGQGDARRHAFVLRSLILHMLSKIGCSDRNIPVVYNCICILLSSGSGKTGEEGELSGYPSDKLANPTEDGIESNSCEEGKMRAYYYHKTEGNLWEEFSFNKLYLLHCYDKLVDVNENIISKYFKYVEGTFELASHSGKNIVGVESKHIIQKSNKGRGNPNLDEPHEKDCTENWNNIEYMTEENINVLFDLKNVLILLKLCRFYNVSNYINSIIKMINSFFKKYKSGISKEGYVEKVQNGIIKMSIQILVILSMKKYIEFEIIYNLLKKNFLKNTVGSGGNGGADIICSVVCFTRHYIKHMIYEKEKLCAEQYDILYHTKLKYIFKDLYKLLSVNNESILAEIVNVMSEVYPVYYQHFDVNTQGGSVSGSGVFFEPSEGGPYDEVQNISSTINHHSSTMYSMNPGVCELNVQEKKNLLSLFFDKNFVHESFMKSQFHQNIYENLQKEFLKDEINNLSLYNLRNENNSNSNHLVRVLYKLFYSNIKNDKISNFNYYVKLLLSDKFQHLEEIISILKNLPFFHVHYVSFFFYVLNCFFEKMQRKFDAGEDFILHVQGKAADEEIQKTGKPIEKSKGGGASAEVGKKRVTYEIICNRMYEEIRRIIGEDNLNVYVFYPVLSILCKHNNDINEILNFFYERINSYIKEHDGKLQGNKNEVVLIFLCLNYIHTNVSQIPNFYTFLTNLLEEVANRKVRNILFLCLSSCCYYTNLSGIEISMILALHTSELGSGDGIHLEYLPLGGGKKSDSGRDIEQREVEKMEQRDDDENLHFFISIGNLCFYLYKHYNSHTFDETIRQFYDSLVKSLQRKVDNAIIPLANVMMYLYIKKVIDVYEMVSTFKMVITNLGNDLVYDSKYVIYGLCSLYRVLTFYHKKNFDCFVCEEIPLREDITNHFDVKDGDVEAKQSEGLKGTMQLLSHRMHKIIVQYFEELDDKNVSLISYCNLIGIRNLGVECISTDYFDSNEYSNMTILFMNRFIKKDFEIKKCVSATNNILACTESEDEDETLHGGNSSMSRRKVVRTDLLVQERSTYAKQDISLFLYQNDNYKLNNDIIVNDHGTILTLIYLFCYKYYEEVNTSLIRVENIEKKNMLYHVYSNLLRIENYIKGFLKVGNFLDIDANSFRKDKEYEQVKLNILLQMEGEDVKSLHLFKTELFDHLRRLIKSMKLINYVKLDVQIKDAVLNIYSYVTKLIRIFYILLQVMIEKITENISQNMKRYYEVYEEFIRRVHILYECRVSIFEYFSLFSSFNNSYGHIFCNFSNYFEGFSTYEKYMYVKCITNFERIKKEEIKFVYLNVLKGAKLFHEDSSLWIYAISILNILLKKIYKSTRRSGKIEMDSRKSYYDLGSYIKFAFITVFNETVVTRFRDNYYNHYSVYMPTDEYYNTRAFVKVGEEENFKNSPNYEKWKNRLGCEKPMVRSTGGKRQNNENSPKKFPYVDIPFNVMLCIADFLAHLCKIIIKEKLDDEINVDELLKNFPVLIQGYVMLKLRVSSKRLNLIKNKILFYEPKYHFTFRERLQDFYCAREKFRNEERTISLTLDHEKLFHYFHHLFWVKECIYLAYIYSHFGEKQKILDGLLQMCSVSQVNKDYLYVVVTSFVLFCMKCKNSSFLLNNFMYNFGPLNELSGLLGEFLAEGEGVPFPFFGGEEKREELPTKYSGLDFTKLNTYGDLPRSSNNWIRIPGSKSVDGGSTPPKDIELAKILFIIEEEFLRTKMRNSFRKNTHPQRTKDKNLLHELFLEKDMFFLKKLGIFYMIKNNDQRTKLRRNYNKMISLFCKKEKQNLFIKPGNIRRGVPQGDDITTGGYTEDFVDNSYMNMTFFNANAEDNAFISGEREIFTKYLTVPLCMKDVFTFFELNLNKNILTNSYNKLFDERATRNGKKRDNAKVSESDEENADDTTVGKKWHTDETPPFSDLSDIDDKDCNNNSYKGDMSNDMEKTSFMEKQRKKKKFLLYDSTLLNYLSSKYYSVNNYELYIVHMGFLGDDIREALFEGTAPASRGCVDHIRRKELTDKLARQFALQQNFFKNLTFFFITFPKGIVLNSSEYFFPDNRNHFVQKVMSFLWQEYVSKYG